MPDPTATQARYLAFIHAYIQVHGYAPAESEIADALQVSAPSVNQMVKTLEKKGLVARRPGEPRSLEVLAPEDRIPRWRRGGISLDPPHSVRPVRQAAMIPAGPPANLYVLSVYLIGGPVGRKFANKQIGRVIEIRGDQTLSQLHEAIFKAYDRWEQHMYEFQFGKRPFDPDGPKFGLLHPSEWGQDDGDARTTKLGELGLKPKRVFGYWFDFGDDWFHQINVERVEKAIPTVTYPRIVKRAGKSPPQY